MTTLTTAIAALQTVVVTSFAAQGAPMNTAEVITQSPFDIYKQVNTVYIYPNGGQDMATGLGYVNQYRDPRLTVEIMAGTYANAEALTEALRLAWINDFNVENGSGAVGSGYLRAQGIKNLEIGLFAAAPWDDRGLVFRRKSFVILRIKD